MLGFLLRRRKTSPTRAQHDGVQEPTTSDPTVSRSDVWLDNLLSASRALTGIGKTLPFPFVQGACESVEVLLTQISLMKSNKEELMTIAQEAVETVNIVTNELKAFPQGGQVDERYQRACEQFVDSLGRITSRLQKQAMAPRGFKRIARRFFEAQSIQGQIVASRQQIEQLKSGLTLASVVGTRAEVSVISNGVGSLRTTAETTQSSVSDMHISMHDKFETTHGQLEKIHETIKSAPTSSPEWNLESHDHSQGHVFQNQGTGTVTSTHGAIIIGRPPPRFKANVSDRSQSHRISNSGKMARHHGPTLQSR